MAVVWHVIRLLKPMAQAQGFVKRHWQKRQWYDSRRRIANMWHVIGHFEICGAKPKCYFKALTTLDITIFFIDISVICSWNDNTRSAIHKRTVRKLAQYVIARKSVTVQFNNRRSVAQTWYKKWMYYLSEPHKTWFYSHTIRWLT